MQIGLTQLPWVLMVVDGWGRYYRLFTHFYATALMYSNVTLTNSSWTQAHIQNLLKLGHESLLSSLLNFDKRQSSSTEGERSALQPPLDERGQPVYDPPRIVYPPCATREFTALPLFPRSPQPVLISLAQFRPEKDQAKQIRAVALLCAKWPEWRGRGLKLVMMGSSRNKEDEERVRGLRELARELGVQVGLFVLQKSAEVGLTFDFLVCACRTRLNSSSMRRLMRLSSGWGKRRSG